MVKDVFELLEEEVESVAELESVVTDEVVILEVDKAAVLELIRVVVFCGPTMELSATETIR